MAINSASPFKAMGIFSFADPLGVPKATIYGAAGFNEKSFVRTGVGEGSILLDQPLALITTPGGIFVSDAWFAYTIGGSGELKLVQVFPNASAGFDIKTFKWDDGAKTWAPSDGTAFSLLVLNFAAQLEAVA